MLNPRYQPLFDEGRTQRYVLLWGGRGRGGSFAASTFAAWRLTGTGHCRCFIMRQVFADIRHSIFADVCDRLEEHGYHDININSSSLRIHHGSNYIASKGFLIGNSQRKAKLKSLAGATDVIIEEANEVSEEQFAQLNDSLRRADVRVTVVLIFNAVHSRHWIVKSFLRVLKSPYKGYYRALAANTNTVSIHSTYRDNVENINKDTCVLYESYQTTNIEHYRTEIQGYISEKVAGKIFDNYELITLEQFNLADGTESYGVDIGWSAPTTLVHVKINGNVAYINCLLYSTHQSNEEIIQSFSKLSISKYRPMYIDPAVPKERAELKRAGYNAKPANNLRNFGLRLLKGMQLKVVEDKNLVNELELYSMDLNDHTRGEDHAIDAMRYAIVSSKHTRSGIRIV